MENNSSNNQKWIWFSLITGLVIIFSVLYHYRDSFGEKKSTIIIPVFTGSDKQLDTAEYIDEDKFHINFILSIPGDSAGGTINITKEGNPYKKINSEGVSYPVALDFNSRYLVECSKNGYTTKVIYINTAIPDGREKEEFAKFTATIELHKVVKGKMTDATKPVGGIKYNTAFGDFDKVMEGKPE
jgi:hypothetical protein